MFEVQNAQEKSDLINSLDEVLKKTDRGKELFFRIRIFKIILSDESLREYFHIFTRNDVFDETIFDEKIQEWLEGFKGKSFTVRSENIIEYDIVKEDVYFSDIEDFDDEHLSTEILEMLSQVYDSDAHTDQELVDTVINYAKSRLSHYLGELESLMKGDEARAVVERTKEELLKEISQSSNHY